jgi:tetraacyldisaccharide-1-P 4'-kinase
VTITAAARSPRTKIVVPRLFPEGVGIFDGSGATVAITVGSAKLNVKVPVFFTSIDYDTEVFGAEKTINVSEVITKEKVIVAGIAKPKSFFAYLQNENDVILTYSDHHHFSENDIQEIINKAKNKIIITTEKDYVRLKGSISSAQLYYLPIKIMQMLLTGILK